MRVIAQAKRIFCPAALFFLFLSCAPAYGQSWWFALMGDSRSGAVDFTAALNYISEAKDSSGRQLALPEFIIHAGDLDPVDKNYALYRSVFSKTACPRFLPVMGNHDLGYRRFICDSLLPAEGIRDRFDKSTVSYCVDIRNVRIIVVDQYKGTGSNTGCINDAGIRWVEQVIDSSGNADHIFIAMHEPAFCRWRHVGNGFDACPDQRNRFWDMIVRHRDKVRAVFSAHSHYHSVMRVCDPRGPANDGKSLPFEADGVFQFDAGGAGNSADGKITVIAFFIDGQSVRADVVQSKSGTAQFSVTGRYFLSGESPKVSEQPGQ
jgi:hypothetical protein